jgi:hypothetical protein
MVEERKLWRKEKRVEGGKPWFSSSRGQGLYVDLIVSMIVFLAMLLIVSNVIASTQSRLREDRESLLLRQIVSQISDQLILTQGIPAEWNNESVRQIGLANSPRAVNETKLVELKKVEYDKAKELMGIGRYELFLQFSDERGFVLTSGVASDEIAYYADWKQELKRYLNGSDATWDFYWGGGGDGGQGSARGYYSGGAAEVFSEMLANASNYSTLVLESPSLTEAQINITALKQFVEAGGLLVYEGQGSGGEMLLQNFNMSATTEGGSKRGVLLNETSLLNSSKRGDLVNFTQTAWAFTQKNWDNKLHLVAVDSENRSNGLVAWWGYGKGIVYYLTSVQGELRSDNSGIAGVGRIAYTYAKGDSGEGSAANYGFWDWLNSTGLGFDDYASNWSGLLQNIAWYDAIVFESPDLAHQDLSDAQQQVLMDWVYGGGKYVQKKNGTVVSLFNLNLEQETSGTVSRVAPLLKGVVTGDSVDCLSGYRVRDALINYVNSSGRGLVSECSYGKGRVYYVCDSRGTVSGSVSYDNVRAILNHFGQAAKSNLSDSISLVGEKLEYGFPPGNSSETVSLRRVAVLEDFGKRIIGIKVVIWRQS